MATWINAGVDPGAVHAPRRDARTFHRSLSGYAPTPVHALPDLAAELELQAVLVKDESNRLGLPAFKVLGAAWAVEQALRNAPETHTLVAASAGNHGRAVARVAAQRGLACRVFLPARALPVRRQGITSEGAEVLVVEGSYEDAVAQAEAAGRRPGCAVITDVGRSDSARWVIDGYATLFDEAAVQARYDAVLVPVGVGSLAAAAARHGAEAGIPVIGVEPETAACLTASLQAGEPTRVPTPGTTMAGLDCAEVSPAAWPSLRAGIRATVTVSDDQAHRAVRDLARAGLQIGESGAAPLAGLRALMAEPQHVREAVGFRGDARALLIATEGPTAHAAQAATRR